MRNWEKEFDIWFKSKNISSIKVDNRKIAKSLWRLMVSNGIPIDDVKRFADVFYSMGYNESTIETIRRNNPKPKERKRVIDLIHDIGFKCSNI